MKYFLIPFLFFAFNSFGQFEHEWNSKVNNPTLYGGDVDGEFVVSDQSGSVYTFGEYEATADFDISGDTSHLFGYSNSPHFLIKYDSTGDLVWKRDFPIAIVDLKINNVGNLVIFSTFSDSVDMDLSSGIQYEYAQNPYSMIIAEYDSSSTYLASTSIGVATGTYAGNLTIDHLDNYYISGTYTDTIDMDPSASSFNLIPDWQNSVFMAKYNTSGNLLWAQTLHQYDGGDDVEMYNTPGGLYMLGDFNDTIDLDPGVGVNYGISNGSNDFYIGKYSLVDGNMIWANSFGSVGNDYIRDLIVDTASHIYLSGEFGNVFDLDPSPSNFYITPNGGMNIFLAKFDSLGGIINALNIGSFGTNGSISTLNYDGGTSFYMMGEYGSIGFTPDPLGISPALTYWGSDDVYIAKFNLDLSHVWSHGFGYNYADEPNGMTVLPNGNVISYMDFRGSIYPDPADGTTWDSSGGTDHNSELICWSTDSIYQWSGVQGEIPLSSGGSSSQRDMALGPQGESVIVGTHSATLDMDHLGPLLPINSVGSDDIYIAKYDSLGNALWVNSFGSTNNDEVESAVIDSLGNIYVTGHFRNLIDLDPSPSFEQFVAAPYPYRMFVAKYDPSGNFLWATVPDGQAMGTSIKLNSDQSKVVVLADFYGTTDFDPGAGSIVMTSAGSRDVCILELDVIAGVPNWGKQISGSSSVYGRDLEVDQDDNIALIGRFSNTIDTDPSLNTFSLSSAGSLDGFVCKLNSSGDFIFAERIGGSSGDDLESIATDSENNIYVSADLVDGSIGSGIYTYTSIGSTDACIMKFDSSGVFEWFKSYGSSSTERNTYLDVDVHDNIYLTFGASYNVSIPTTNDTVDFIGSKSLIVAQFNSSGICNFAVGNSYLDSHPYVYDIELAQNNDVYLGGVFTRFKDMDFTNNIANITTPGSVTPFLTKYSQSCIPSSYIEEQIACNNYYWQTSGLNYASSGVYFVNQTNANGCDSNLVLDLTIIQPDSTTQETVNSCVNYFWPQTGLTYNITGDYYDVLTGNLGCDSVITLHLTIENEFIDTTVTSECDSYQWSLNGTNYTSSGVYDIISSTINGCDSIHVLDLTITTIDNTVLNNDPELECVQTGATYQWLDCDLGNIAIAGANGQQFTPPYNGNFAVEITFSGCTSTSSCEAISTVEIGEYNPNNKLIIYPNPFSNVVQFGFESIEYMSLFDAQGRLVSQTTDLEGKTQFTWDLKTLQAGTYFIQFTLEGRIETRKLIKL